MEGKKRRAKILEILNKQEQPVSGTELAQIAGVSRQVIVQDVAILRAENKEILSTNKGYLIHSSSGRKADGRIKVFQTNHATEDTLDELQTIVDYGGKVLNVFIEHEFYGQIIADLIINNRLDAAEFVNTLDHANDQPLKTLTGGCHYHTVTADSQKNLDRIEVELRRKGYLV